MATRYLLQQQQQQDLLGGLLGNTAATRAGLEQAAMASSQLNLLRAMAAQQQPSAMAPSPKRPGNNPQSAKSKNAGYYDASHLPDPPSDDEEEEETKNQDNEEDGKKKSGATVETFPQKLYRMIEEADEEDMKDVVSFFAHGRAFAIHKPRAFITDLMPRYFSTSRMSSFQRQLNLYGFRRITEGRDKGGYFHEFFLKGRKGLCKKIKRKKTPSNKPATSSMHHAAAQHAHLNAAQNAFGGAFAGLPGLQGAFGGAAMAGLQGAFGGAAANMRAAQPHAGLGDATNLFQMQMLAAGGSFNPTGAHNAAGLGSSSLSNDASALNHLMNLRAAGQGLTSGAGLGGATSLGGGAFGGAGGGGSNAGLDPAATSALLEQKKTELLLAQLQQQQQQQQGGGHQQHQG